MGPGFDGGVAGQLTASRRWPTTVQLHWQAWLRSHWMPCSLRGVVRGVTLGWGWGGAGVGLGWAGAGLGPFYRCCMCRCLRSVVSSTVDTRGQCSPPTASPATAQKVGVVRGGKGG